MARGRYSERSPVAKINMRKTFFTIFPAASNTHLTKDVGQIPYQVSRLFGYDSHLVTEANSSFENAETDTPALTVTNLRTKKFFVPYLATLIYVMRLAKKIDVLNLYHLTPLTKITSIIYKALNPQGFCYVKLDVNVQREKELASAPHAPGLLRSLVMGKLNERFFRWVDLFSAESAEAVRLISTRYPLMTGKVIEITNGVEIEAYLEKEGTDGYGKKRDLMITVGRLGTYHKNSELLLQALENVDLKHWAVALIGPSTDEFKIMFNKLMERRPELGNSVQLVGNITNRKELLAWYKAAKVFILTSRSEGFPLVFSEAQCCANYLVSTDVSSIDEITNFGKFGTVVDSRDATSLALCLQNLIENPNYDRDLYQELIKYAHEKYDWNRVLPPLHQRIRDRCNA